MPPEQALSRPRDPGDPRDLAGSAPRLAVRGLHAGHGRKDVIHGVDLEVAPGRIVTLFGHNGAGKTTVLNCVAGLHRPSAGEVLLDGTSVAGRPPAHRVRAGMALVPADDFVFAGLTVAENLALGAVTVRSAQVRRERTDRALETWPDLADRLAQRAGTLSGGQRRMLSLAIALMSDPSLLLLDEPSLGLAPKLADDFFADLRRLADDGLGVLLVEQAVAKAIGVADEVLVMQAGRVIVQETPSEFASRDSWWGLF